MEDIGLGVFDTEGFLRLISQHPSVYDPRNAQYKNRNVRNKDWESITKQTYPTTAWERMTPAQCEDAGKTIRAKWKSYKDAFTRYRRQLREQRSGSGAGQIPEYIHAKDMEFLLPVIEMRKTTSSWQAEETEVTENPEAPSTQETSLSPTATQRNNEGGEIGATNAPPPRNVPRPSTRKRPRDDETQEYERLMGVVSGMSARLDDINEWHLCLLRSLAPWLLQVPAELRTDMVCAVFRTLGTFLPPAAEGILGSREPPILGPYISRRSAPASTEQTPTYAGAQPRSAQWSQPTFSTPPTAATGYTSARRGHFLQTLEGVEEPGLHAPAYQHY